MGSTEAEGEIVGVKHCLLLDTGSELTVVRPNVLITYHLLVPQSSKQICGVTRHSMCLGGPVDVSLVTGEIQGNYQLTWQIFKKSCILEFDFLVKRNHIIDFSTKQRWIRKRYGSVVDGQGNQCWGTMWPSTILPSKTVQCRVSRPTGATSLVELITFKGMIEGMMLGRTLISLEEDIILVIQGDLGPYQ